jgi:hypothetical protein
MNDLEALIEHVSANLADFNTINLPPDVADISTVVGEECISMSSRAWTGGPFRIVRTTLMQSEKRIKVFNLVAYPRTEYSMPLFATDIVVLNGKLRIGVVDAMPVFPSNSDYQKRWIEPFAPLAERALTIAPRFELKMEWSREYLSKNACLTTGIAFDQMAPLYSLWQEYWSLYLSLSKTEGPAPAETHAEIEDWHREYNRDHAEVELKRNPLNRYYGADYGRRFIEGFLFSDTIGNP